MTCALSLTTMRRPTSTPFAVSSSTSANSACRSTTTPLPMTHVTPGCRMPDGIRRRTNFVPLTYTVWPALWPPCERATTEKCGVSRSTIFPLPSSPHCAPRIARFISGLDSTSSGDRGLVPRDGWTNMCETSRDARVKEKLFPKISILELTTLASLHNFYSFDGNASSQPDASRDGRTRRLTDAHSGARRRLRQRTNHHPAPGARAPRADRSALPRRRAHGHDARAFSASRRRQLHVPGQRAPAGGCPRRVRRDAGLPDARQERQRRTGDDAARRISRAADLRELPRPPARAPRPRRRSLDQRQPVRADEPVCGPHAAPPPRQLAAVRN